MDAWSRLRRRTPKGHRARTQPDRPPVPT
jgi:hypothetical protein